MENGLNVFKVRFKCFCGLINERIHADTVTRGLFVSFVGM